MGEFPRPDTVKNSLNGFQLFEYSRYQEYSNSQKYRYINTVYLRGSLSFAIGIGINVNQPIPVSSVFTCANAGLSQNGLLTKSDFITIAPSIGQNTAI